MNEAAEPAVSVEEYESARAFSLLAPPRAKLDRVAASTAGWTDPSLTKAGVFYPKSAKKSSERLRFFSEQFCFVEVDATYYALLSPAVTRGWVESTDSSFRFHIKAHPILTGHPLDTARLPKDILEVLPTGAGARLYESDLPSEVRIELERRFFESIAPLVEAGRLDTVLLQFPPWFRAVRGNVRRLEAIRERFPDIPFSVEMRSGDWFEEGRRQRVLEMLGRNRYEHVIVDEPQVLGAVPWIAATTGERVTLRMHGRNFAGWAKKGASVAERFNYLYAPKELREVAGAIAPLRKEGTEIRIVMNNCVRDFAVLGAKGMMAALQELK